MLSNFHTLIQNQYEAAFCTLFEAIARCPDESWMNRVARYGFSQSAFHTLFFADLYLGPDIDSHGKQPFHQDHAAIFETCGQWDESGPNDLHYERNFLFEYLQFCRMKMELVVSTVSDSDLAALAGFPWLGTKSRAEVHVYNIRHVQHHAAQLILVLRRDAKVDVPWVKSGWEEFK